MEDRERLADVEADEDLKSTDRVVVPTPLSRMAVVDLLAESLVVSRRTAFTAVAGGLGWSVSFQRNKEKEN